MSALSEFLNARIAEERVNATLRQWHDLDCDTVPQHGSEYTYPCDCGVPEYLWAEAERKADIVHECVGHETCGGGYDECSESAMTVLKILAGAYTKHPDYRQEWKA